MKKRKLLGLLICGVALVLLLSRTQTNTPRAVQIERKRALNPEGFSGGNRTSTIIYQFFLSENLCFSSDACTYGSYKLPEQLSRHANNEVRHIGFLKVHKAASTTMQNMFFRFGMARNLSFVFTYHPNYFSREASRHLPVIRPRFRNGYDILCNHAVFNISTFSRLLPSDTRYIAIVRDPLDLFISSVNFFSQKSQLIRYIGAVPGNKVQNLIRNHRYDMDFFSYTKNAMARDFGFPKSEDVDIVKNKIGELNNIFTVVLLVEHFDESLILMKRYLSWKVRDIIFIANNVRKQNGYSINDLSLLDVNTFRNRNKLDYVVYRFFFERFWRQFEAESNDIHMEVLNFKKILKEVSAFCNSDSIEQNVDEPLHMLETRWNEQFNITYDDCDFMIKDELTFIEILRAKQGSELPRRFRG
ncbi:galactose-3-O-sulfotransferase 2-like isoform X1 [Dreissena polymorpha]|uniref:Galactosylceramide sulfotransferase n=2 Tax=Dreissena polymorpha TaxID=45954 RepID=A0A9D4NBE5_DREPO|nr:galactose-3-O-sulfotransferase 2-like isoform X1 [Dreissena polymorpha]KAH3891295.1 hypothetical protein DPMN_015388 [Dreissena polymorpha]